MAGDECRETRTNTIDHLSQKGKHTGNQMGVRSFAGGHEFLLGVVSVSSQERKEAKCRANTTRAGISRVIPWVANILRRLHP